MKLVRVGDLGKILAKCKDPTPNTLVKVIEWISRYKSVVNSINLNELSDPVLIKISQHDVSYRGKILSHAIKTKNINLLFSILCIQQDYKFSALVTEAVQSQCINTLKIVTSHVTIAWVNSLTLIKTKNIEIVRHIMEKNMTQRSITDVTIANSICSCDNDIIEEYCKVDEDNILILWGHIRTIEQLLMFLTKYGDIVTPLPLPEHITDIARRVSNDEDISLLLQLCEHHVTLATLLLETYYKWNDMEKFTRVWELHKSQIALEIQERNELTDIIESWTLEQENYTDQFELAIANTNIKLSCMLLKKHTSDSLDPKLIKCIKSAPTNAMKLIIAELILEKHNSIVDAIELCLDASNKHEKAILNVVRAHLDRELKRASRKRKGFNLNVG